MIRKHNSKYIRLKPAFLYHAGFSYINEYYGIWPLEFVCTQSLTLNIS